MKALGFESNKTEIDNNRLRESLKGLLQVKNLIVLSGAGSSILKDNKGIDVGGLTMNAMVAAIKSYPDFTSAIKKAKDIDAKVITKINESNNLEVLLTDLDSLISSSKVMASTDCQQLIDIQKSILKYMHKVCDINSDEGNFPHAIFLTKLLVSRKLSSPRIKVFTLNYDTLFEQAAQKIEAIAIDGFSFSQPRKFQGGNFDLDIIKRNHNRLSKDESYCANVMHLYKLHGSVDWKINGDHIEQVNPSSIKAEDTVMIYPGSHKYQESYSMPFYEIISRFQSALREPNTSLIVIGYSFGDEHINRIILEAVTSNLNLNLYIVSPSAAIVQKDNNKALSDLQDRIMNKELKNVFMISTTFKDFSDTIPYFGGESTPEVAITSTKVDIKTAETNGVFDENPNSAF